MVTKEDAEKGYGVEIATCAHRGCKKTFHPACCVTISYAYGLRDVTLDSERTDEHGNKIMTEQTKQMYCPEHHKALLKAHRKQEILFKHLAIGRDEFLT